MSRCKSSKWLPLENCDICHFCEALKIAIKMLSNRFVGCNLDGNFSLDASQILQTWARLLHILKDFAKAQMIFKQVCYRFLSAPPSIHIKSNLVLSVNIQNFFNDFGAFFKIINFYFDCGCPRKTLQNARNLICFNNRKSRINRNSIAVESRPWLVRRLECRSHPGGCLLIVVLKKGSEFTPPVFALKECYFANCNSTKLVTKWN